MIIGLHGKKHSGKDAAYLFIEEWAKSEGRPVRRDAFADRLKLSAVRALGFTGTDEEALAFANSLKAGGVIEVTIQPWRLENEPVIALTGRQYLQWYGDEAHRQMFGADFWVNQVMLNYDEDEFLVITDVRYPNEAEAIRWMRGARDEDDFAEVWNIVRPNDAPVDPHDSEQPLPVDLIDHCVVNDRDLDYFRDLVISRVERLVYV